MLLNFRVVNHRSIAAEQGLTFEVASKKYSHGALDTSAAEVAGLHILTAAAIYGGNASGKSNFLDALFYMKRAVTESARFWGVDEGTFREPFEWGEHKREPSLFEVEFMLGDVRYNYGFVLDNKLIIEEWLSVHLNKGKPQLWFERKDSSINYGNTFKKNNPKIYEKLSSISSLVRDNALLISVAAQMRVEKFVDIYRFFSRMHFVNMTLRRASSSRHLTRRLVNTNQLMGEILNNESFVNFFGPGTGYEDNLGFVKHMLRQADIGVRDVRRDEDGEFYFLHEGASDDAWLHYDQESNGTKTIFKMLPQLMYTLSDGGLLVVDEIELSLHSILSSKIIKMFTNKNTNKHNAQLLFATHDTNILGNMLGEDFLRRDQIWFAEKDRQGQTFIYPLTNFEARKDENKERGYLQGRYGAIPVVDDFTLAALGGGDEL